MNHLMDGRINEGREVMVRDRAYAIWREEGQPEGKDREHWLRAEQEYDDYGKSATPPGDMPDVELDRDSHSATSGRAPSPSSRG